MYRVLRFVMMIEEIHEETTSVQHADSGCCSATDRVSCGSLDERIAFALADSSAAWERVADVVWLPGAIATHFTHLNVAARVDHYFYTVLFAGLFFALMQLLRDRIFSQTADLSGRKNVDS
jgi:hypothetical protein